MDSSHHYNWNSHRSHCANFSRIETAAIAGPIDEEDRVCRACHSNNLRVDWAQGDRICTDCGLVDESHIRDDRPEWKDFADAEDIVKGLPSGARSGLVVVDETKYIGGLQPTTLSKQVFGGNCCPSLRGNKRSDIRKSLQTANRKLDHFIEKEHERALKRARLSLRLKRKHVDVGEEFDVQPELDAIVLHEEEEAQRAHTALYHQKWSLDRALLLHSHDDEQDSTELSNSSQEQRDEARSELTARLDKTLKRASLNLFIAYSILKDAARRLELPNRVLQQATQMLSRYAAQKDGLTVKGIASRLKNHEYTNGLNACDETVGTETSASLQLKNYNNIKQMAALASALLFVEARKQGLARPLQEVCASIQYPNLDHVSIDNSTFSRISQSNNNTNKPFIKAKHCNNAMKELRAQFPDYMRASSVEPSSSQSEHFVEHATRKLELPPVATASIQVLVEEIQGKTNESTKISTTCAAVTLLVCMAGAIMQRLARQAMESSLSTATRQIRAADVLTTRIDLDSSQKIKNETRGKRSKFDLFAHPAVVVDDVPSYEMRQMWDAWAEQMPWGRSLAALEQAYSTSKPALLDFYRTKIYPKRVELLSLLQESSKLRATPRAAVLLSQMSSTASPLLNIQGKVI